MFSNNFKILILRVTTMSEYNIYATSRVSSTPIYSEEEISGYYFWLNGVQRYLSKADMRNAYRVGDQYFTYRSNSQPRTACSWEISTRREWYLKSYPNNTSADNLLSLPII